MAMSPVKQALLLYGVLLVFVGLQYVHPVFYTVCMWAGFISVAPPALWNDSMQMLGPWYSTERKVPWYWSAIVLSVVTVGVHGYGWYYDAGDIAFNNLDKVPLPTTYNPFHMLPGPMLLWATTKTAPISNTMLVLGQFGSENVFGNVVWKSLQGLFWGSLVSFVIFIFLRFLRHVGIFNNQFGAVLVNYIARPALTIATIILYGVWLKNDTAHFAVYLHRHLTVWEFWSVMAILVASIFALAYTGLGVARSFVDGGPGMTAEQSQEQVMPHTTMLLLILAFVLYVMQPMMGVPMSSSIVFIGIVGCHNVAETIFTREVWKELRVFFGKVLWAVGGAVVAYAFFLFGKFLF